MLSYDVFKTSLGWMGLLASEKGVRRTTLPQPSPEECVYHLGDEVGEATLITAPFNDLRKRLEDYFQGKPVTFIEPLDLGDATPFFKVAWEACRSIPIGETRSYAWLAARAGRPRAARAAGQAMARNRLPILIPCHRVIGSDGNLCGFGSGRSALELKQKLLDLEKKALGASQPCT